MTSRDEKMVPRESTLSEANKYLREQGEWLAASMIDPTNPGSPFYAAPAPAQPAAPCPHGCETQAEHDMTTADGLRDEACDTIFHKARELDWAIGGRNEAHAMIRAAYAAGRRRQAEIDAELFGNVMITMRHARTFITSRQKMHPVGVTLWDELFDFVESAAKEIGK